MRPFLALITPLTGDRLPERPVDPGYGVEAPVDPGYGVGIGGRPPRPSHPIARPGRPVDPGYGVDEGGHVDNSLPEAGTPEHPIVLPPDPEPGSPSNPIVLPGTPDQSLPPGAVPKNVVVWVPGRGYIVVQPGGAGGPPAAQPKSR